MKINDKLSAVNRTVSNLGFTLVEMMVALALAGIVFAAIGTAYLGQRRSATLNEQVAQMQQNHRAAIFSLEYEIRMASYDPRKSAGAGIVSASATMLDFTFVADLDGLDNNGDGNVDETNELARIRYRVHDDDGDGKSHMYRTIVAQDATPNPIITEEEVAENIDAVEFFYTMKDGATTLTPGQLDDIRMVTISVLARADRPDSSYSNPQRFIPASGNMNWAIHGGVNPPDDNYRRRLLTTTIQFRNMGL